MRVRPTSVGFTLLLGSLVALPSFGIDTNLPALTAISRTLNVTPSDAGLTISLFMLGFAISPLIYGPVSDRYGRKPVIQFACLLFAIGAAGCAMARSLPTLLAWRIVQGTGAGASMTITIAIVRDLFDGQVARMKISYIAMTTMTVPMLAPTLGIGLMAFGGWQAIYAVLAGVGAMLLLVVLLGLSESARPDRVNRLAPSAIAYDYIRVLTHPRCVGYLLVSASTFGSLFAYVSGSSLFLVNVVGLGLQQYGFVFAVTSLGIMAGSFLSGRLNRLGLSHSHLLGFGLTLATAATLLLLFMALAAWMPLMLVISLLVLSNLAFGLIMPNAMERAMEPLPQIAGAAGAVMGCIQMAMGAAVSGLVAIVHAGHSALSMTALMALCALLALASFLLIARPAECVAPL